MNEAELNVILKSLTKYIQKVSAKYSIPDVMLGRSLNETWFSDTLAWLLDPKTGNYLGVKFLDQFVEIVAKKRTSDPIYNKRATALKFGKKGKGRAITAGNRLSLKNSAVLREFYLSKSKNLKHLKGAQNCDLAIIDLDSSDSIFITIENKLFGTNHPHQLENYYSLVEDKYGSIRTREYVYLTLFGEKPVNYGKNKSNMRILDREWICISWLEDIYDILEKHIQKMKGRATEDVRRVYLLLGFIKEMTTPPDDIKNMIESLAKILIDSSAECLVDELNRLSKKGGWRTKENIKSSILHTSLPASILYVQMLPNLFITVQGKRRSKEYYEKILIPFGAYPDQVYHMLYLAARDVYSKHFNKTSDYLNNNRKLTVTRTAEEKKIEPLLNFIYKYKNELLILLYISKLTRNASKVEEVRAEFGDDEAVKVIEGLEL